LYCEKDKAIGLSEKARYTTRENQMFMYIFNAIFIFVFPSIGRLPKTILQRAWALACGVPHWMRGSTAVL